MPEAGLASATKPRDDIRRAYRVRIVVFLVGVVVALFALSTVSRTITTLRRLEVVEAERDAWQRPDQILRALGAGDGSVVVDLGCGAGYFAMKLSDAVGPRGRVIAVDIRRVPLVFVRLRALLGGRRNIAVVRGNPDDPHLSTSAADAVLVANTFHELADPAAILAHAFRALRPEGRVVLVDPTPEAGPEDSGDTEEHHHEWPERAERRLRRAGFEIVDRQDRFIEGGHGRWWLIVGRRR